MLNFKKINKLEPGDKVAILSPSFAAPGQWPEVYQYGLNRLLTDFRLVPVQYPSTSKLGASTDERSKDLIAAFLDPEIKGVIASLGGNDQVTYIKNLPKTVFEDNPKPFFGFSDNTHFENFLWLCGVPSFYGGSLFGQFAMPGKIDDFTQKYLDLALFQSGEFELLASTYHSEHSNLNWSDFDTIKNQRNFIENPGWIWDKSLSSEVEGTSWGGCLESIDEMLRHNVEIPTLEDFEQIILFLETSEEQPDTNYVFRILRALGSRGILGNIKGLLVGRPETWSMDQNKTHQDREKFRQDQQKIILETIRKYNQKCPIIQNLDFGHTHPQIPIPNGKKIRIDSSNQRIFAQF